MIDNINKFHRISPRRGRYSPKVDSHTRPLLDRLLTFAPHPDEEWTFDEEKRRIFVNGEDIGRFIGDLRNDIGFLCGCSEALEEYRRFVWGRGGKGKAVFNGIMKSLQDKIHCHLISIYDDLTGGVHFESDGKEFWINNVNVGSVLKLYRLRPTEKARLYLLGLRDKLGLILARQRSSTRYDGIYEQALKLIEEIRITLECVPADVATRLLSDGGSA